MELLTSKICTPCRGGVPPLTPKEAAFYLEQTPEWTLNPESTELRRSFKFANFRGALEFVKRVGELAESEGHHPDIEFGWGYCNIRLYTHKIKGLHENDFILAAKIDAL